MDLTPAAVFDIETENWERYVLGALLTREGEVTTYGPNEEREFTKAILKVRG